MKSLLFTLAVCLILLAQLVSGAWYAKKCAHKTGTCRKICRDGELETEPISGICPKKKFCCVLGSKDKPSYPGFCDETSSTSAPTARPEPSSAETMTTGENEVTETTVAS